MSKTLHAVGTIFINKKEEILLLLREGSFREGGLWGLVGGEINEGENKLEAAIRKIKEEIGLDANPSDLMFIKTYRYLWKAGDKNIVFEAFKLNIKENAELNLNTKGHSEYMWIHPKEAYKRKDLMVGLYQILSDLYNIKER